MPSPLSSSCQSDHDADRPHVYITETLGVSSCGRTFHMQRGVKFPPKKNITAIGQASRFRDSGPPLFLPFPLYTSTRTILGNKDSENVTEMRLYLRPIPTNQLPRYSGIQTLNIIII